jgi:hypothetical protein
MTVIGISDQGVNTGAVFGLESINEARIAGRSLIEEIEGLHHLEVRDTGNVLAIWSPAEVKEARVD